MCLLFSIWKFLRSNLTVESFICATFETPKNGKTTCSSMSGRTRVGGEKSRFIFCAFALVLRQNVNPSLQSHLCDFVSSEKTLWGVFLLPLFNHRLFYFKRFFCQCNIIRKKNYIKFLFIFCIKTIRSLGKYTTPRRSGYFRTMNVMRGKIFHLKSASAILYILLFFIIYMYDIVWNVLDKFLYEIVKFIWKS